MLKQTIHMYYDDTDQTYHIDVEGYPYKRFSSFNDAKAEVLSFVDGKVVSIPYLQYKFSKGLKIACTPPSDMLYYNRTE